jgi:hypothetical protein
MSDKSLNNNDNSSSHYYEPCSNSIELNDLVINISNKKKDKSNKSIENFSLIKEDSGKYYESPPKKSVNNINYTNTSTGIFSSNRPSNLNNYIMTSNKDSMNKENERTTTKKSFNKKININTFNNVKKRILSPIDENTNNFNYDNSLNKKNSLSTVNNNCDTNQNININIIINKKKNQKINNKLEYNNITINKNKIVNNINNENANEKKIEIINTEIDKKNEKSVYSSIDEKSNSSLFKQIDKIKKKEDEEKMNIKYINKKKSINSFLDSNSEKKSFFVNGSNSIINDNTDYKKMQNNTVVFQDYMSFMINSVIFEDIPQDYLTVNDLKTKYNLREIPVRRKEVPDNHIFLKTLIELQIFNFGDSPIWCMKISKHGKYLAAGNKAGKIRIYQIMGFDYEKYQNEYNSKTIINYLHFVDEKAIKELSAHKGDITDLSWSSFKKDLLLSASVDHFVILWDISKEDNCLIEKFDHNDIVTSAQFSPTNEILFVTGCFDKFVRIYNISNYINKKNNTENYNNDFFNNDGSDNGKKGKKKSKGSLSSYSAKKIKDFFNLADKITSVSFFPQGNQIAIGTINGKINIYDLLDQTVRYNYSFTCRNRVGKNSLGKKVTCIAFINKKNAIVTTCDSCVRLISMNDGKNLSKYKGYENEDSMIRASVDLSSDVIISGSENGFCYVWHIINEEGKKRKNYNYEYFQPFSRDIVECSIIIDELCFVNYIKKILKLTNRINVISVIINSTDKGKIEVLLNIDESNK